jgi:hypothetical protein
MVSMTKRLVLAKRCSAARFPASDAFAQQRFNARAGARAR